MAGRASQRTTRGSTSRLTRSTATRWLSARTPATSSRPPMEVEPGSTSATPRSSAAPATSPSPWPMVHPTPAPRRRRQPGQLHLRRYFDRPDLGHSGRRRQHHDRGVTTNNWITGWLHGNGLDGSPIEQIVTDPARGSHEAYAVTQKGVYVIGNSIPSATIRLRRGSTSAAGHRQHLQPAVHRSSARAITRDRRQRESPMTWRSR